MAKATLEFDLDDIDDKQLHARMLAATKLCSALTAFFQSTRDVYKNSGVASSMGNAEFWSQQMHKFLADEGVFLDEIYS